MRTLEGYDLLILDEAQASMLFQVFAIRHERKSTYVITNHEFSKWVLVDRIAHKSILLNMNSPSSWLGSGG